VVHGNLTVDVPRSIFRGSECILDQERAAPFIDMLQARYPWLTRNSVDVLLKKARMEMMRVRDEESKGKEYSRILASQGKYDEAIEHMRLHLELDPDDADSWYELGNLLCKNGDAAEGYKAYNKGRSLFKKTPQRRGR